MVHRRSLSAASGCIALLLGAPAHAASDITVAAIAVGRLYVAGTTDQPHTKVTLDGKFDAESDGKGLFQFELVYHPASCIVRAAIDGKTVEAVVGQCGEVCKPAKQADVPRMPALGSAKPSSGPASAAPTPPARPDGLALVAPEGPAATNALPPAEPASPTFNAEGTARPILRPPLPPPRPVDSASIAARPVSPAPAPEPSVTKPRHRPAPAREMPDAQPSAASPDAPEGSDLY